MDIFGRWRLTSRRAVIEVEHQLATAEQEIQALRRQLLEARVATPETPAPQPQQAMPGVPPQLVRELITLADRLTDLTDPDVATDDAGRADAARTGLRWLTGRVSALLTMCDVAPIDDDGALDFMRHEVVADQPAPQERLVDHIAATVRVGYVWHDRLLRPQQVVAYVPATTSVHNG